MGSSLGPQQIVTDGLVLHLDAANEDSYPKSGTAWKDLSGNGNDGTLVNGVGFSGNNAGTMTFDAINDRCDFSSEFFDYTGQSTFECWTYPTSWVNNSSNCGDKRTYPMTVHSSHGDYIGFITSFTNRFTFQRRDPTTATSYVISPPNQMNLNNWYHLVGTISNPGSAFYINGVLIGSLANTVVTTTPVTFRLGYNNFNCTNTFYSGLIPISRIYNRALSADEVLQNYNATKERFTNR